MTVNGSMVNASDYTSPCDVEEIYPGGGLTPTAIFIFNVIIYLTVCVAGLVGNTLVIYVVLRYTKMQTVTNMYILNLAFADECFLVGIPFLVLTMYMRYWMFGSFMCKAYMTTTSINQFTSSIFLTIMSADRYIAVCHPITAPRLRTPLVSRVVSLTAWFASGLLMIPVFMYAEALETDHQISCNIFWPENKYMNAQTAFTLYTFVLGFGIPLFLIFIFYLLVIQKLKTVGPKKKSKEKRKSHRKVTKLVLTVITVYIICWLPYWVVQVALIFSPPNQGQAQLTIVLTLLSGSLSYLNSAVNPILYAFLSDNFRKSFMKACSCIHGVDGNATLHAENSVFPRRNRTSEKSKFQNTEDSHYPDGSGTTLSSRVITYASNTADKELNKFKNGLKQIDDNESEEQPLTKAGGKTSHETHL